MKQSDFAGLCLRAGFWAQHFSQRDFDCQVTDINIGRHPSWFESKSVIGNYNKSFEQRNA
jgi:predicted transcriptional regulator YheO